MQEIKKLTEIELEEIENLVRESLDAISKKEAEVYITSLRRFDAMLKGYPSIVFCELISYVRSASGRVSDKGYKKDVAIQMLNKFLSTVRN